MTKQVTAFDLDENMTSALQEHISIDHVSDLPLHEAPAETLERTDVALIFVFSNVTDKVCEESGIETIISLGAGTDHINMDACREANITACNTPHYGDRSVAEHTFALLLTYERHMMSITGKTLGFQRSSHLSQRLAGKTFGAIGTGGIGKSAIRIAQGFGMDVIGYDVEPNEELQGDPGFRYQEKREVIRRADYLSLYVPAMPATQDMIDNEVFTALSDDAVLINTARPDLIDHSALLTSLKNGGLRGALLDVVAQDYHDAFSERDDTIITPHHAFYTQQALSNMAEQARNILNAIKEDQPISQALN